jgi:hypothetical protein
MQVQRAMIGKERYNEWREEGDEALPDLFLRGFQTINAGR